MFTDTCFCNGLQILLTTDSIWTLLICSLSDIITSISSLGKHSNVEAQEAPMANYSVLILFESIISTKDLVMYERWLPMSSNNLHFVLLQLSSPFVVMTVAVCINTTFLLTWTIILGSVFNYINFNILFCIIFTCCISFVTTQLCLIAISLINTCVMTTFALEASSFTFAVCSVTTFLRTCQSF